MNSVLGEVMSSSQQPTAKHLPTSEGPLHSLIWFVSLEGTKSPSDTPYEKLACPCSSPEVNKVRAQPGQLTLWPQPPPELLLLQAVACEAGNLIL